MAKVRVPVYGTTGKSVRVNSDATNGAQEGVNLWDRHGRLVDLSRLIGAGASVEIETTDEIDEGVGHLYFTKQRAQNAVGAIVEDSPTVLLEYDGSLHTLKALLAELADSGQGELVAIERDQYGRVAGTRAVDSDDLEEGAEHLFFTPERARAASAASAPTRIADGATYTVPADTQLLFTLPIDIEGDGVLDVTGDLAEVA